jgi:hypothetical protein
VEKEEKEEEGEEEEEGVELYLAQSPIYERKRGRKGEGEEEGERETTGSPLKRLFEHLDT